MLDSIMLVSIKLKKPMVLGFLNRTEELARLNRLLKRRESGLAVIWGRRRIGKTRLLLEWVKRHTGLYWVADESAPSVQRRYLAQALSEQIPGFADVEYPDWRSIFNRLGREAKRTRWRGPLVLDEMPYLVAASPEVSSVLQGFIDHEAKLARLVVAIAGSSQQMMQGLALAATSPLYGRADQLLHLSPLPAGYIGKALGLRTARQAIEAYTLWGGVPRYWELAAEYGTNLKEAAEALVLDPLGPLSDEPQRLLRDEIPSAVALRPVLDAIGAGARRVSEIASRLGQPASSLARPLARLQDLGFIVREIPFGSSEKTSKKALYHLGDPFLRWWFTVVAPRRGILAQTTPAVRKHLLEVAWPRMCANAWETLCRQATPYLTWDKSDTTFAVGQRFWHGQGHEWDVVSASIDGSTLLVGECKWTEKNPSRTFIESALRTLKDKGTPPVKRSIEGTVHYVLFVPTRPASKMHLPANMHIVDAAMVLRALAL